MGLTLFVIQGLLSGSGARDVTRGTMPFAVLTVLLVVLLFLAPPLALWLPTTMHVR